MEDQIKKIVEDKPGTDSDIVNEALRKYLVTDQELLDNTIKRMEKQRDQKRLEKQRIEQEIWELDDKIEDLKDRKSRAKAVEDVRSKIGKARIEKVARITKKNKYDSDSRSYTETEVIEKHTRMISEEHEDLEEEDVREVLDLHVNV